MIPGGIVLLAGPADTVHVGYHQGLNVKSWQGNLNFVWTDFSTSRILITERLNSSQLNINRTDPKWKDRHQLSAEYSRLLSQKLTLNLLTNSFYYADHQSGYQEGDIATHAFLTGATYTTKSFRLPVYLGFKEDRRFGQIDRGPHFKTSLQIPMFEYADYFHHIASNFEIDNFRKRKNQDLGVLYTVSRQFYEDTADTLRLRIYDQRRDYYITSTGDVESRQEKIQTAENLLSYRLGKRSYMHVRGGITNRSLAISLLTGDGKGLIRERKDFKVNGGFYFLHKNETFSGLLQYTYSNEEQTYQLARDIDASPYSGSAMLATPDNQNIRTMLMLRTKWKYSLTDTLLCRTSLQRYRYDTPDEDNFDDRDELRIRAQAGSIHWLSPKLRVKMDVNVHLFHFVYIFGERSADNNWTRIFSFKPRVVWNPSPRFRISQAAEVLANYVDYDFEEDLPSTRSFLYRKFRIEDSTTVQLMPRTSMSLYVRLELDETGKLSWREWSEQRLTDRNSQTIVLGMQYKPWRNFSITPGYTYFERRGFRYTIDNDQTELKEAVAGFKSHGPTCTIRYLGDRLRFSLYANTILVKTQNQKNQFINRIEMDMRWHL